MLSSFLLLAAWWLPSLSGIQYAPPAYTFRTKGITLIDDGKLWSMEKVQMVSIIHRIVPPNFNTSLIICNMTYQPYAEMLGEFHQLSTQTTGKRRKRYLSIMGLLSGLTGTVLGVKNWISIQSIQNELNHLRQHQEDTKIWVKETTKQMNDNIKLINILVKNWNTFKNVTTMSIRTNKCRIDFLLEVLPVISYNVMKLSRTIRAMKNILKGSPTSTDIRHMVNHTQIVTMIQKTYHDVYVPTSNDFYSLCEVIPGHIDAMTLSFSFLLLVPIFNNQSMSTKFVLNTGYVDLQGYHRQCNLHGIVVYHHNMLLQLHTDGCTQIKSNFYCQPHATPVDPRSSMLTPQFECPRTLHQVLPLVQYRNCWIAITTAGRKVSWINKIGPITRVFENTTENGYFIYNCMNVTKIWISDMVIYQRSNTPIHDFSQLMIAVHSNHTLYETGHFEHVPNLHLLGELNYRDSYTTSGQVIPSYIVITIVILILFLIGCITSIHLKKQIKHLAHDHMELVQLHQTMMSSQ